MRIMAKHKLQNALKSPVITERGSPSRDARKVLQACHRIARQRLTDLLSAAFEDLDDVLFVLAEHAGDHQRQSEFFDGMRALRLGRQPLHENFSRNLQVCFNYSDNQEQETVIGVHSWDHDLDSFSDSADYEERLAVSTMVAKAENLAKGTLAKLDRCLALLSGKHARSNRPNALAPEFVTQAFFDAVAQLDVGLSVRIVIYKHFEKEVLERLPSLYRDVITAMHQAKSATTEAESKPAPKQPIPASLFSTGQLIRDPADFFQIEDLEESTSNSTASRRCIDDAQFLDGLLLLQSEFHEAVLRRFADLPLRAADIHHALLRVLSEIEPDQSLYLSEPQLAALGIAGSMLEESLENGEVATTLLAALSRLQPPLARLIYAFGNENLAPAHPVARFVATLHEVTNHWMASEDEQAGLHDTIIDLLQDVDDDPVVFTPHTEKLTRIRDLQVRRRAAKQNDNRHSAQHERIRQARSEAAHIILSRLREHPNLALSVQDVLRRPWANLLVLMHLRYGKTSQQYQHTVETADSLIHAVNGDPLGDDRISHRIKLAQLIKNLQVGLELVAFDDERSRELISALIDLQTQANRSLAAKGEAAAQKPLEHEPTSTTDTTGAANQYVTDYENDALYMEALDAEDDPPGTVSDTMDLDQFKALVRNLEKGTWLQIMSSKGSERAKLSWISPISHKYLLVNRNGLKIGDFTLAELTDGLLDGSISIVGDAMQTDCYARQITEEISRWQRSSVTDTDGTRISRRS